MGFKQTVKICAPCAPALLSCEGDLGQLLAPQQPGKVSRVLEWSMGPVVLALGSLARLVHESPSLSISRLRQLWAHPAAIFRKSENSGVG